MENEHSCINEDVVKKIKKIERKIELLNREKEKLINPERWRLYSHKEKNMDTLSLFREKEELWELYLNNHIVYTCIEYSIHADLSIEDVLLFMIINLSKENKRMFEMNVQYSLNYGTLEKT